MIKKLEFTCNTCREHTPYWFDSEDPCETPTTCMSCILDSLGFIRESECSFSGHLKETEFADTERAGAGIRSAWEDFRKKVEEEKKMLADDRPGDLIIELSNLVEFWDVGEGLGKNLLYLHWGLSFRADMHEGVGIFKSAEEAVEALSRVVSCRCKTCREHLLEKRKIWRHITL